MHLKMKRARCSYILGLCMMAGGAYAQKALPAAPQGQPAKAACDRQFGDTIFSRAFGRIISLDGQWEIAAGTRNKMPRNFPGTVPVPGLVSAAQPAFQQVGQPSALREVFWYRKKFRVPGPVPEAARLKVFKAMYGSRVYLNGKAVGENAYNFTPGIFNIKPFLKGNNAENELLICIGAYIGVAADTVVNGGEPERHAYPPGIYDRVEVILSGTPYIVHTQVVPDIINKQARIVITAASTVLQPKDLPLKAEIFEYETGKPAGSGSCTVQAVTKGVTATAEVIIPVERCRLWTPEHPNLYVLRISGGGYSYQTRFGMRKYQVDTSFTNRALLNGKPYYIRGTNFAIHRFFSDPLCKEHPWDKAWVRQLIRTFTGMGMNGARFCISPAPELWYDIADEEGLMVFDEYPIWYAYQPDVGDVSRMAKDPRKKWGIWPHKITAARLAAEYAQWMQERWNHPSVVVWDAQNETWTPVTGAAIRQVRKLDLSNRPWDNGWSPPVAAADIREAHPYFESYVPGTEQQHNRPIGPAPFRLADLPSKEKVPATFYLPYQHAYKQPVNWYWQQPVIINEYAYLWLNRDGSATTLTKPFYDAVLGPQASTAQRRELYAKYLAAVTEYWRSLRTCIGVLYPFGLGYSLPAGETSDSFTDIAQLTLDPYFMKYVPDAFAATGICIDYWQEKITAGPSRAAIDVPLIITNDTDTTVSGTLSLQFVRQGRPAQEIHTHFEVAPFAQSRVILRTGLPPAGGKYQLIAGITDNNKRVVRSYRDVVIE